MLYNTIRTAVIHATIRTALHRVCIYNDDAHSLRQQLDGKHARPVSPTPYNPGTQ